MYSMSVLKILSLTFKTQIFLIQQLKELSNNYAIKHMHTCINMQKSKILQTEPHYNRTLSKYRDRYCFTVLL